MSRTILYGIIIFNLSIGALASIGTIIQDVSFCIYLEKHRREMDELYGPKRRKDR